LEFAVTTGLEKLEMMTSAGLAGGINERVHDYFCSIIGTGLFERRRQCRRWNSYQKAKSARSGIEHG
jgi:hypothetical protein